jgi:hypothetical protein
MRMTRISTRNWNHSIMVTNDLPDGRSRWKLKKLNVDMRCQRYNGIGSVTL